MAARCRCGARIEWHHLNGRRLAYDTTDGWLHDCPQTPTRPPATLTKPGPKTTRTVQLVELEPPPVDDEPAVINSRDYDQWVHLLAAELGVRERDLAYTVAYRAACEGTPNNRHTAA